MDAAFADVVRDRTGGTPNGCVGTATRKPHLANRLVVEKSMRQRANDFDASVELMQMMARACGHTQLSGINLNDRTTWRGIWPT